MDKVIQRINDVFCKRQANCNRNKRRARNKAARKLKNSEYTSDEDIESDSDSDASSVDEFNTAQNVHWPIQDHDNFLEIEQKMLKNEAFAKDLVSEYSVKYNFFAFTLLLSTI